MSKGITISDKLIINSSNVIRYWFESHERSFYGGNSLQRDGYGYDSSYVDALWTETEKFFNTIISEYELKETSIIKKELIKKILIEILK
jgi:hypothetical protein